MRLLITLLLVFGTGATARGQEAAPNAPWLDIAGLEKAAETLFAGRETVETWLPPFTYRAPDGKTYAPANLRRERTVLMLMEALKEGKGGRVPIATTVEVHEYTLETAVPLAEIVAHYKALLSKRAVAVDIADPIPNFRVGLTYTLRSGRESEHITWTHDRGRLKLENGGEQGLFQNGNIWLLSERGRVRIRVQADDTNTTTEAIQKALTAEAGRVLTPFLEIAYPGARAEDFKGALLYGSRTYRVRPAPGVGEILDWYQKHLLTRAGHANLTRYERLPAGEIPGQGASPDGQLEFVLLEGPTVSVRVHVEPDGNVRIELQAWLQRVPPRKKLLHETPLGAGQ